MLISSFLKKTTLVLLVTAQFSGSLFAMNGRKEDEENEDEEKGRHGRKIVSQKSAPSPKIEGLIDASILFTSIELGRWICNDYESSVSSGAASLWWGEENPPYVSKNVNYAQGLIILNQDVKDLRIAAINSAKPNYGFPFDYLTDGIGSVCGYFLGRGIIKVRHSILGKIVSRRINSSLTIGQVIDCGILFTTTCGGYLLGHMYKESISKSTARWWNGERNGDKGFRLETVTFSRQEIQQLENEKRTEHRVTLLNTGGTCNYGIPFDYLGTDGGAFCGYVLGWGIVKTRHWFAEKVEEWTPVIKRSFKGCFEKVSSWMGWKRNDSSKTD